MRKHLSLLVLAISSVFFISSCGNKNNDAPSTPGMMRLDLSSHGMPITIEVPDSTKGTVEVVDQTWGATEIRVGKYFQISIQETDGDIELKKSDITSDPVVKFKRYVIEEPTAIVWESEVTEPQFHFYTLVKSGKSIFVIEDITGDIFNENEIKTMFNSTKTIQTKEVEKS